MDMRRTVAIGSARTEQRPLRRRQAVLGLLAGAVLVAGCSGSPSRDDDSSAGYATGGTFTMALTTDLGPFDPYRSASINGFDSLAYDSLVNLRPDGSFTSGLAEKWSANASSAQFTLRPGITCSDGTPLTARQVAAAISFVSDPANQSTKYGVWTPTERVVARGDDAARTVDVRVAKPFGFLLRTVGMLPIVCAKGLSNPKSLATGSDGTGPFVLSEVVPGQSYTFVVREDYRWGPGGASTSAPGTPGKVVLRVITNKTTAANLVMSGEVNFAQIDGEDQQRLDAQGVRKAELAGPGVWLWYNHIGDQPTADARVRRALTAALDLDEVVKVSGGSPATGLVAFGPNPCEGDNVAGRIPAHDLRAAEQLLDSAGWTRGADGFRSKDGSPLAFDLMFMPSLSSFSKPTAELMAQRWQALGVRVRMAGKTGAEIGKALMETSDYGVYIEAGGFNLPIQMVPFLSGENPPKGQNFSGIKNAHYGALAAKATAMVAPAACPYWNQAEQTLYRDLDILPVSNRAKVYYLNGAEAEVMSSYIAVPTSIRVLSGN